MPTNSAVREMLPPKRLICANQIFALEHFARLAQRQSHQLLAAIAVRHRSAPSSRHPAAACWR